MTVEYDAIHNVIVSSYRWTDTGHVAVTLSWAPGKRRTFSVPADQFNDGTVAQLRAQTARDVLEGRIS